MNKKPKALIMVGHDLYHQGAKNSEYNVSEWGANNKVADHIMKLNEKNKAFDVDIANIQGKPILVYNSSSKKEKAKWEYENETKPDLYLELHFNSAMKRPDGSCPQGCEMLHWKTSKNGKRLAEILLKNIIWTGQKNRGLKPKGTIKSRGGISLGKTKAPAVILEPAFISCPWEARMIASPDYQKSLAQNILKSLFIYFKSLKGA